MDAVKLIEEKVSVYEWALKLDIHSFFDTLSQERLLKLLGIQIHEEDVLDLLKKILRTGILDEKTGDISFRKRGVYQGSSISPILSNIYMMEFDELMSARSTCFVRYSDDMLFLGKTEEELESIQKTVKNYLESVGLALAGEKSSLCRIEDGFEFLGYRFDKGGKTIGKKAEESLKERLECMWMISVNDSAKDKLQKGSEILGGWEQYYRMQRKPGDILEYAVALYMSEHKSERELRQYVSMRFEYENPYADLLEFLVGFWKDKGMQDYVRMEYEQYFHKLEYDANVPIDTSTGIFEELLEYYGKWLASG